MQKLLALFGVLSCLSVVKGDCNWALALGPVIAGECIRCEGDVCGADESLQVKCASNGNSAALYEYSDSSCTDEINSTDIEYFSCGNSGSCDEMTYTLERFVDSEDCTGGADGEINIPWAQLDNYCFSVEFFGSTYGYDLSTDEDGSFAQIWSGIQCNGTVLANISTVENCTSDGTNSTRESFSGSTNGKFISYTFIVTIFAAVVSVLSA